MTYIFTEAGQADLHHFLDPAVFFAFDLDGTLAPIADNPEGIRVPEAVIEELAALKEQAVVAIITGRSKSNAQRHLGIVPHYLVGNHGAEGIPGWQRCEEEFKHAAAEWERQLRYLLPDAEDSGIMFENKGMSLSIHYRRAQNKKLIRSFIIRRIDLLKPRPRRISGKYVENLLPGAAPDKGAALRQLMQQAGCTRGFFVGDDDTDEDVFRLAGDSLFTVRVGRKNGTRARYYVLEQDEVPLLLHHINNALAKLNTKP